MPLPSSKEASSSRSRDLKETFNKYRIILSCKILEDKETQKSRESGFVKFADKKSAVCALNDADNLICKGRNILVRFANDKKEGFKGKKRGLSGLNQKSNKFNHIFSNNENKRNGNGDREKGGIDRGRGSRDGLGGNERGRSRRSRGRGFDRDNNNKKKFNNSNKDQKGWGSIINRERFLNKIFL